MIEMLVQIFSLGSRDWQANDCKAKHCKGFDAGKHLEPIYLFQNRTYTLILHGNP
jgi:hypothetical protein